MVIDDSTASSIRTSQEFGRYLRGLRGRMTQSALARRSEIDQCVLTRQRVSNIENGTLPTSTHLACYLRGCENSERYGDLEAIRSRLSNPPCPLPTAPRAGDDGSTVRVRETPAPAPARQRRWWSAAAYVVGAAGVVAVLITLVNAEGSAKPDARTNASNAQPECAANFICFWSEPNFGGRKLQEPPDWATGSHCTRLPFSARSAMNNTKERQRGYANSDCSDVGTILQYQGAVERSIDINAYKHT